MTPKYILYRTARLTGLTQTQMLAPTPARRIAWPRIIAMALSIQFSPLSVRRIARAFHRDHSSVLSATRRAETLNRQNPQFHTLFTHLHQMLEDHMHIYISGPTDGIPGLKTPAFSGAEAEISRNSDWLAVNPQSACELAGWGRDHTHKSAQSCRTQYVRLAIANLIDCDAIVMLKNWQSSSIARMEHEIAKQAGLQIFPTLQDFLNAQPTRKPGRQEVAA